MKISTLLILLISSVVVLFSSSAPAVAYNYISGQGYRILVTDKLQEFGKAYDAGWVDGFLHGLIVSRGNPTLTRAVSECADSMTQEQPQVIIRKYLEDHPEEWNVAMGILAVRALRGACNK